jgi:hypothetical protein
MVREERVFTRVGFLPVSLHVYDIVSVIATLINSAINVNNDKESNV